MMPRSVARPLKRFLLSLGEIAVIPLGFFLSYELTDSLSHVIENEILIVVFLGGLALTIVCLVLLLRKTRASKFTYNVEGWWIEREERRRHPRQAKLKRLVRQISVWIPTAIAAFVLFFYPVATHVLFPGSGRLKHYVVPVPWNWFVVPAVGWQPDYRFVDALVYSGGESGFGMVPFWRMEPFVAEASFGSVGADGVEFNHKMVKQNVSGSEDVSRLDFVIGRATVSCWEFDARRHYGAENREVECVTPLEERERDFYAHFVGPKKILPRFYAVIRGVKPSD